MEFHMESEDKHCKIHGFVKESLRSELQNLWNFIGKLGIPIAKPMDCNATLIQEQNHRFAANIRKL